MWGKPEQTILWIVSYFPVLLIGVYRYFYEKQIKTLKLLKFEISNDMLDLLVIVIILILTILLFANTPKLFFRKLNKQIEAGVKGKSYIVREFDRLNLNDYTFFLLTLILPLITVDFTSTISLLICFSVIGFIVTLLVSIDYVIACPLFFVSTYKVWRVKMVEAIESGTKIEKEVFVITKVSDFYDREFQAVKLMKNVYFLTENQI